MAIEPISIPNAAAVDFGNNDVRHFSEGDAVDVVGMSNPTRHLAQRDVELAKKLNSVIAVVNNNEQFVPIPIPRIILSQNSEEITTTYRIPSGFEARILNASIGSVPSSSGIELSILYSTGFGNSTGTSLVTTSTEYTGGAKFYAEGEFIIVLRNKGATSVEAVGSIMMTMRPQGDTSTLLLPSTVKGEQGDRGLQGDKGDKGDPGSVGPNGSPGLVWASAYNPASSYVYPQVASFSANGSTDYSSYVCTQPAGPGENPLTAPTKWDLVVKSGTSGTNAPGPAGDKGFDFKGDWVAFASPAYVKNDVVRFTDGTIASTYYCGLNGTFPDASLPPPGPGWTNLFSTAIPAFYATSASGTIVTLSDYQTGSPSGSFGTITSGTTTTQVTEFKVQGPGSPSGMAFLRLQRQANFSGGVVISLPQKDAGASANWLASDCVINAYSSGTTYSLTTLALTEHSGTLYPSVSSGGTSTYSNTIPGTVAQVSFAASGSTFTISAPARTNVTFNVMGMRIV